MISEIKNTDTYVHTNLTVYRNNNYNYNRNHVQPKTTDSLFRSEDNNFYLKSNLEQGFILINHMTQTTSDDLLPALLFDQE